MYCKIYLQLESITSKETQLNKELKVLIIVQARMGATRLPGKPMMRVNDKSLLQYLIERLKHVKHAHGIVIATTMDPKDDIIADTALGLGVDVFRGSETDVLSRYALAAKEFNGDVIVRITADCPLIDPAVVDQVIEYFLHHYPDFDYVANNLERTYPRGMDTEVFSRKALDRTYREATTANEKEHVTLYIYRHPETFHVGKVKNPIDLSNHRWTVDTAEDFQLIKTLIQAITPLKKNFTLQDLVELINLHPEWNEINAHIKQKIP